MPATVAITREVSPAISRSELTHLSREEVDVDRACAQHAAYRAALENLGCVVRCLPADPAFPDSVFVEDTAVVLDEFAMITRPGAVSRWGETVAIERVLGEYRSLETISPPGTLDGGDVLVLGRDIYVGLSSRSNEAAIAQLALIAEPRGYAVLGVELTGCLHLKSAACEVGSGTVLVQPRWVDPGVFGDHRVVLVDDREPFAANAVHVNGAVVYPEAFPRTRERLGTIGIRVVTVPADELAKAEGGVTCCSLLVSTDPS